MKNFNYFITVLLITFLLQSCGTASNFVKSNGIKSKDKKTNYVYLDDLIIGKELDRAKSTSASIFFDYLMNNEVVKNGYKPDYEVVLETSTDVYYGVVKPAPTGTELIVDPLYKAPIEDIKLYFPGFKDIEGAHVKSKVFYYFFDRQIETNLKPYCENSYNFSYKNFDIQLTEKGIRVDALMEANCYEKTQWTRQVSTLLNPNNLDVIQEYILTKDFNSGEQVEEGKVDKTTNVLKKSLKLN